AARLESVAVLLEGSLPSTFPFESVSICDVCWRIASASRVGPPWILGRCRFWEYGSRAANRRTNRVPLVPRPLQKHRRKGWLQRSRGEVKCLDFTLQPICSVTNFVQFLGTCFARNSKSLAKCNSESGQASLPSDAMTPPFLIVPMLWIND